MWLSHLIHNSRQDKLKMQIVNSALIDNQILMYHGSYLNPKELNTLSAISQKKYMVKDRIDVYESYFHY